MNFVLFVYQILREREISPPPKKVFEVINGWYPGHFISWLVEMLFFGVIQSLIMGNQEFFGHLTLWTFLLFIPTVNYALFPLVQVLTSHDLREHIFSLESRCNKPSDYLCLMFKRKEVADEAQLQVVENGHCIQETHL